jgi:hypothetical protein
LKKEDNVYMSASNFLLSSLISSMSLLLQHLSRGSVNVPELQAEVTSAREVATAAEAIYVTAVLVAKTSGQEATAARDSATILVKGVEDWNALTERGAWERVSRLEAENAAALAFAREDVEGLA